MSDLKYLGISSPANLFWNLTPAELTQHTIDKKMGTTNDTGALVINTGEFTGRSPKDKFMVKDTITENHIDWANANFNIPFTSDKFNALYDKVVGYLNGKDVYSRDCIACADDAYKLNVRVVTEYPWSSMFASNMFIRPTDDQKSNFAADWHVVCAPGFMADPAVDGTRQSNFAAIDFTRKIAIIGGTGYTGEIKKGIFTVLNFVLPVDKNVFPMHCSANIGKDGDTALFFGLSGTGKTTLSADPNRGLIGDDEHGWTNTGVFNFEGGCYAKCIDLTEEKEPDIFRAIKPGAILENIEFYAGTNKVDFASTKITENTRVSYPIDHIDNAVEPSVGGIPKNVFFLAYDAYGVLPPISQLNPEQAMYYFMSGFTAKVAGTETGVTEPQLTFSACFGAPFLPLHPSRYAALLGEKLKASGAKVWMINTGMTGGVYGVGSRMKLPFTRAMITAALNGELNNVGFTSHPVFGLSIPNSCPNVPAEILDPRAAWSDKVAYDAKANELAAHFNKNFTKFEGQVSAEVMNAAPKAVVGSH
jgi:phosphoenolpyruvate carboxykinase (ATP)